MANYLDKDGLLYFWQKIKTLFALKTDLPTATSDLTNDSNFVTDASYVHTDNNYTSTEKTKLSGIATGAEVNVQADWNVTDESSDAFIKHKPNIPSGVVVDDELDTTSENAVQNKVIASAINNKVDKVSGKGLSTNDYTTAEQTKLAGIAEGAQVNAVTNVRVNGTSVLSNKVADITMYDGFGTFQIRNAGGTISTQDIDAGENPGSPFYIQEGSNVTLTVSGSSASVPGITISATDTTYSAATQSANGLMSSSDKTKLDGFSAASNYALKTDITGMYKYKGSVATASLLPSSGQETGDVYNIEAASVYGGAGMNVAWNGSAWDPLGEIFSITAVTNAEIDAIVAT